MDGFKSQWCVVLQNVETGELRARICPSFAGLLTLVEKPAVVAIGLPEVTRPGGWLCEQQARKLLGSRASSVLSAVGRAALGASSWAEADHLSRNAGGLGIGAQAWGLVELREADAAMTTERQEVAREVHPEVSFWAMNGRARSRCARARPSHLVLTPWCGATAGRVAELLAALHRPWEGPLRGSLTDDMLRPGWVVSRPSASG